MKFERLSRIRVDDFLILTKRGELRNQFAGGIHGEGIAIEHELIIAADKIAIADRPMIRARLRRDHFKAARRRAQPKWRRTQIKNDLRALVYQTAHRFDIVERSGEILVRPDVLTNRDTDFCPAEIKRCDATRRLEITVLIKNIVSR